MQMQYAWLKPGIWGGVIGCILTMIVGFSWGGWTTHSTANQEAIKRADAAVTATLVPLCPAQEKIDASKGNEARRAQGHHVVLRTDGIRDESRVGDLPREEDANRDVG